MSLVRIKNISQSKLVFSAVREAGDMPLTLEAGEEKDVYPSVATQPSLRAMIGTKVIIVTGQEIPVAPKPVQPAPAAPPVVIMAEPMIDAGEELVNSEEVYDDEPTPVTVLAPSVTPPPSSSNVFKPRKGRR
jgi:hypothetical protein